jgi:hypothetical protein
MKPNEYVLTIVQLAAPIAAFAFGIVPMGIFLSIWIVVFGLAEWISKMKTNKTLSQHVWAQPLWKRIVLSAIMVAGMIALGYHFIFGGGIR